MKTTSDLVADLEAEAASAYLVVLAVGFPTGTKFIGSDLAHDEAVRELNKLKTEGGYPLGFIRCVKRGDNLVVETRILPEYANDPVPHKVLSQICEIMGDEMERRYGGYAKRDHPSQEA